MSTATQPIGEVTHTRALGIEPREVESDDDNIRLLTFTAASDDPYTRGMLVGNVREVTDFEGLDESRLNSKRMPLLDSHQNEKLENILGRIVAHRLVSRGVANAAEALPGQRGIVLEVTAEFTMSDPHSKAAYEKVKAGLVSNVSIGYSPVLPEGMRTEWHTDAKNFDYDNDIAADVQLINWEVQEVSLVPVPADNSIGIGRSRSEGIAKSYEEALTRSKPAGSINPKSMTPRRTNMTEPTQPEAAEKAVESPATTKAAEAVSNLERRLSDIEQKAKETPSVKAEAPAETKEEVVAARKDGTDYIAKNAFSLVKAGASQEYVTTLAKEAGEGEGLSESQVKAKLWEHLQTQDDNAMKDIGQGKAPAIRASKDAPHNFFSFDRAIRQLVKGADTIDGREAEVLQDYEAGMRKDKAPDTLNKSHSIMIPHAAFVEDARVRSTILGWGGPRQKRYDVGVAIGADDPNLTGMHHEVFQENWLTQRLVNKATVLPFINFLPTELAQDLIGVTESGQITTGFLASENATRSESPGLTFGNRALRWKMAFGRKDFSQRALDQSQYLFGHVLMRLREDLVRRIDEEVIVGDSNTDGGFLGIFNFPSVNTIALGTNGGAITYKALTDMIAAVEGSNADVGAARFVLTPAVKAQIRRTPRLTNSTGDVGDEILNYQVGEGATIDGFPVTTTNVAAVKQFTKGSRDGQGSNGVVEGSFFGDLSAITGGYFSGMELAIDPYSAMETGQTRVYLRQALDVQVDHVEAFSVVKDVNVTV